MGSYTDQEIIRKQNADIEDIKMLVHDMWTEVLDFAFDAKCISVEQKFDRLKNIEDIMGYLNRELDNLKWQPYDTPQTAVDIIGQK